MLFSSARRIGLPNHEIIEMAKYIRTNFEIREEKDKQYGLKSGIVDSSLTVPGFEKLLLSSVDFDRQFNMT